MFTCQCFEDIFEIMNIMHNLLEEAVLRLESHCPQINYWTKTTDQVRIMLKEMLFWSQSLIGKDLSEQLTMI